ncbi:MAG: response regulator, partial [Proteobacteria bacterium]|nr:response regulator [Pseudomonadota bacterium]
MSELPILIVDDEEEFVSTMVQRLRKRGLSSEGVLTGTAAIAKAADSDFSVVLLDMRLPD